MNILVGINQLLCLLIFIGKPTVNLSRFILLPNEEHDRLNL